MTLAAIGLGGNIGDPRATMVKALDHLDRTTGICIEAVSALYQTPPWGKTDQPPFLNAAARIRTTLTAQALLRALLATEAELGRERAERWGPRTVDLDILVFGREQINEPGLHVPHARLQERAFALLPLADVTPAVIIKGREIRAWLDEANTTGIVRLSDPTWWPVTLSPGGRAPS